MTLIVLAVVGTALFDGSAFFKFGAAGFTMMDAYLAATFLYYCNAIVLMLRRNLRPQKRDRKLLGFVVWGLLFVVLSYFDVFDFATEGHLLVNHGFILRQAYFLFFLPLAIVVPITWRSNRLAQLISEHAIGCGFGLYGMYVLLNGTLELKVQITFLLAALVLTRRKRSVASYALAIVILFSPVGVGGEMTQVLVRLLFLLYLVVDRRRALWNRLVSIMIGSTIVMTLLAGPIYRFTSLDMDANSIWRLAYWADEMATLSASFGVGVGFGTSYGSISFLGSAVYGVEGGPFGSDDGFSYLDKIFVTGSHNSFVSIAFRLGIIGIVLLLVYLYESYRSSLRHWDVQPIVPFLFFSAIVIVAFNVGLESPTYLFVFVAGITAPAMTSAQGGVEMARELAENGCTGGLERAHSGME